MEDIKSPYALIDEETGLIQLFEKMPRVGWTERDLENVTIKFLNENTISITAQLVLWGFAFERQFLEDMQDKPQTKYIRQGYKYFWDFFTKNKKPYVESGWYRIERTALYELKTNKWSIKK